MLNITAPFPRPGSFALYEVDGQTLAVRILSHEAIGDLVAVSVQGRFGASANKSVSLAALGDPTPLTAAELAELNRLDAALIGYTGRGNASTRRADALRDRYCRAKALANLLERVPARHFPAAAAARRELVEGARA
jgi:hypothetical protein